MRHGIDFSGFIEFDPEKATSKLLFRISQGWLRVDEKIILDLGIIDVKSASCFFNPETRQIALKFHKEEAKDVPRAVPIRQRRTRSGSLLAVPFKNFMDHFGLLFPPKVDLPFDRITDPDFPADLIIDGSAGQAVGEDTNGKTQRRRKGPGRPRKNTLPDDAKIMNDIPEQGEKL
jgi:hypothetical protein